MTRPLDGTNKPLVALHKTFRDLAVTGQRLATGLQINRAEDDSAGFSISSKLQSRIRGLTQGLDNAEMGLSRIDVANGAMDTVDDILGRATELAVQAGSDTVSDEQRAMLDSEMSGLLAELDELHGGTSFNGEAVFGDDAGYEVLVDEGGETIVVDGESVSAEALGLDGASLADGDSARAALESISDARDTMDDARSRFNGSASQLRGARDYVNDSLISLAGANSRIADADFAKESTELIRLQIVAKAGLAAIAHSNATRQSVLNLVG